MTKVKEMTFVERVLRFINADDDSVIRSTQKIALKRWKKEVALAEKAIVKLNEDEKEERDNLNEYLKEAEEELANTYLNIDIDSVKTIDDRKRYVEANYEKALSKAMAKIDSYKEEIKLLEEITAKALEAKEDIIARYKKHIAAIS